MMRIGVIGAGAIGNTHAHANDTTDGFELAGVADPLPLGEDLARRFRTVWHRDYRALIDAGPLDAAIIATPNDSHVPIALEVVAAGIPVLVEKPIATTMDDARELVDAADRARVPVLVGHHRRFHPVVQCAKKIIASGLLGRIVAVSATAFMPKSDEYFGVDWRRGHGTGGPFLINLIHEIDLLRYLIGEVTQVSAMSSSAARGFAVEDTGAIIIGFDGGALASLAISDAVSAPWSWDLTAGDSPRFPVHEVESHRIGGESASLTLPTLHLWEHDGVPDWTRRQYARQLDIGAGDPYVSQLRHLGDVAAGHAEPLVSAREGMRDLEVIEAVIRSVATGAAVRL